MFTEINSALNTVVVSNDVAAQAQAQAVNVADLLANMEGKRKTWEEGVYRTSNQALYAILAECLMFGGELTTSEAKARRAALDAFCKERGYVVKKDSPLMTHIVKAVFGNVDRRRISTYSLVLRQAQKLNVLPTDLAQWIEDNGGIQEIKLSRSATFVSPAQKAAMGAQQFNTLPVLASVKNEQLSLLADADFIGTDCVLLAEQQADGSFAIRALVRQGSAVNAAYAAVYAQQKAAVTEQQKEQQAANDADGVLNDAA
jgi:hypothetical protein